MRTPNRPRGAARRAPLTAMRRAPLTGMRRAALIGALACALALVGCSGGGKGGAVTTSVQVVTTVPELVGGDAIFRNDSAKPLDPQRSSNGKYEQVSFLANDGQRIPGLLALPANATGPYPCVVVQHGLDSSKADAVQFLDTINNAGSGAIAIDARIHGDRGTRAQREAAFKDPAAMRDVLVASVRDLRRTLDYLATIPQCDPTRTGYLGFSLGAIMGAMVSGVDTRVHAAALLSGGGDWDVMLAGTSNPFLQSYKNPAKRAQAVQMLAPIDPDVWIPKMAGRSVFFANGTRDDVIVPASARALHDAAKDPKQVVWWDGGHSPEGLQVATTFNALVQWYQVNFS